MPYSPSCGTPVRVAKTSSPWQRHCGSALASHPVARLTSHRAPRTPADVTGEPSDGGRDRRATIAHLTDRQGVDDAVTSVLHGNPGVRGYRPRTACGSAGRSTTRTGVLQGSPGGLRARRWAPLGGLDLRADGDRRRADTDVRHQPAAPGCASAKDHRSAERAHSVGRHDVGGAQLGDDFQLAGSHARRGVHPRIISHRPDFERDRGS